MNLFDVYPLFDIEPVKAKDCYVWDKQGNKYLDLYGGHAVISIGHSHSDYISKVTDQLNNIGFYSNSVINSLQAELAKKLGEMSDSKNYNLFLCNSGAEANENALKLASFFNERKKVIAFSKSFHGRTSAAVSVTDNPKISSLLNKGHEVIFLPFNDVVAFEKTIKQENEICAVIIEGIQGIGGIQVSDNNFLKSLEENCKKNNIVLILDEIQSGYGRTGKFFSFQYAQIEPDIITVAKGMGNGFPVGGVLIHEKFKAEYGMLGTTFGGNHLACAACIAVLDVMKKENLIENAFKTGQYLLEKLSEIFGIKEVRGKGLMIGLEFEHPISELRKELLFKNKIFTGVTGTHIIRLLPPLSLTMKDADYFVKSLKNILIEKSEVYG